MRRKLRKSVKESFALIFWVDTEEITTVPCKDLGQVLRPGKIKPKWRGDLPWVDSFGLTELYEAQILRVSYNKLYLDSLLVNCFGHIVSPLLSLSSNTVEEMKNVKKVQKGVKQLKKKTAAISDNEVLKNLANAFDAKEDTNGKPSNDEPSTSEKANDVLVARSSGGKCTCRLCVLLGPILSPEFVGFFERLGAVLRGELNQEPLIKDPDVMIYMDEGMSLKSSDIKTAFTRVNGRKYDFMFELFLLLVPSSAIKPDSRTSDFPAVRTAILTYINSKNINNHVTKGQYSRRIGTRLRHYRRRQYGDLEGYRQGRRAAANDSRTKRKSYKLSTSTEDSGTSEPGKKRFKVKPAETDSSEEGSGSSESDGESQEPPVQQGAQEATNEREENHSPAAAIPEVEKIGAVHGATADLHYLDQQGSPIKGRTSGSPYPEQQMTGTMPPNELLNSFMAFMALQTQKAEYTTLNPLH